ncbi:helix-turn-helix domain-containing protein [Brevibacterium album]|uniref:helix-turn-helix domain-containing protein n=1 Tax=Brevibacterium album TaxID=417948 RepID=UPI00041C21F5|nr:helix-turn-helix domain-containing protein [Brevibacterium album]
MSDSSALLHPVRLRIVQTLLGEEGLTTRQLHTRLPDTPIATLYRHVSHLLRHGLIEVAAEQQVGGASEKAYRLDPDLANPGPEALEKLSAEEMLTVFTVFASGLISDFDRYVHTGEPDLHADRVSFAQADLWASDEEVDDFAETLMAELQRLRRNGPGEGRRRRRLTTVLVPQVEEEGA